MDIPRSGQDTPQSPGADNQQPQPPPYQPPAQPHQPPAQPYQPPQTPYQPPQAQYQPPAGQYQQPPQAYQQQPGGYQQVPPPPPASQRKGFNWLACCGITCLVLLIIGVLLFFGCRNFIKPFYSMGVGMAKVSEVVKGTDEATVVSAAVPVTTAELAAAPQSYMNQWLAVNGTIQSDASGMSNKSFSSGNFNTADTTPYMLTDTVMVMDLSKAPAVGTTGDNVTAYGQIYVMDLAEVGKIPMVGKTILEEMKKDPQFAGNSKMVFVIAKKVERVGGTGLQPPAAQGGDSTPPPAAPDGTTGAGGWGK